VAEAYHQGFDDALQAIAVAFGVLPLGRVSRKGSRPGLDGGRDRADFLPFPTDIQGWW